MSLELIPTVDMQVSQGFDKFQLEDLAKPLNESLIKERPGPGGKSLKYISGKAAIDTANRVFGVGKWGYRVLSLIRETAGEQVFYTADVELYVQGCPFPFPGQGEGVPQRDTADQYAKARKEAVTDALKRALRHFGDQFGLALYDEDALVESEDGTMKPVKDVHPNQNGKKSPPPPAKKTVEATPPQQSENLHALIGQAKQRAKALGLAHDKPTWEGLLLLATGEAIQEKDLTLALVARLNGHLTKVERERAQAQAS